MVGGVENMESEYTNLKCGRLQILIFFQKVLIELF